MRKGGRQKMSCCRRRGGHCFLNVPWRCWRCCLQRRFWPCLRGDDDELFGGAFLEFRRQLASSVPRHNLIRREELGIKLPERAESGQGVFCNSFAMFPGRVVFLFTAFPYRAAWEGGSRRNLGNATGAFARERCSGWLRRPVMSGKVLQEEVILAKITFL